MIQYVSDDITNAKTDVIAHGCNCAGGFGSGVAGAIAKRYPTIKRAYHEWPRKKLGTCQYIHHDGRIWVNAFTQENYGYDGQAYADLVSIGYCLADISQYMKDAQLKSIAIPKIGCGRGGLNWEDVKLLVEGLLGNYDVRVYEIKE